MCPNSESTTIPTNPRTSRPVGYAFVALSTPTEADRAIAELNGKAILRPTPKAQAAAPRVLAVPSAAVLPLAVAAVDVAAAPVLLVADVV
jgi:RNA recognition motif-containing protein